MKDFIYVFPFIVGGILGTVIAAWWGARKLRGAKTRFWSRHKGDLLRPPGHTLAEKLSTHWDRIMWPALVMFLGSALTASCVALTGVAVVQLITNQSFIAHFHKDGWTVLTRARGFWPSLVTLVLWFVGGPAAIWWSRCKLLDWLRQTHRLKMGLRGEQAVAEDLQAAVRAGYYLFHDIPTDADSNIDHVIVGPAGVFAIETKARAKPEAATGKDPTATFDGTKVDFAGLWSDTRVVRQIHAVARNLAKTLTRAIGREVDVRGVIAIPGWYVPKNNFPVVIARNPEYFAKELSNADPVLAPGEISSIVYQIDRMCRDVHF